MDNTAITEEIVLEMNYTQFVSFVYQWNVPPGAFSTINEWAIFSRISPSSRVLEIACTTGFSGRELSLLSGCSVVGIDLCSESIEVARYNKRKYAPNANIEYKCCDAYKFNSEEKFTHIVLGAALQFFPDKPLLIQKYLSLLQDSGYFLVCPYYLRDKQHLPISLIEQAQRVIGINPTDFDYYTAIAPYSTLELVYENRKDIQPENETILQKYLTDTIQQACTIRGIDDSSIYSCMYTRLREIKEISNELHKRHSYSTMVYRYRQNIYPNRFVEMF